MADRKGGLLHGFAGGVELGNGFDLEADYARATIDACYGVRPGEATAARPSFAGHSSWSPEVGLLVRYRASPRQFVFANLNYERYAKQIRNSPLINASGIPQLILGYQYVLD